MGTPARLIAFAVCIALAPLARAVSVVPPTFDELVAEADTVVRGVVTDVRAEEFDSAQGRGIRTVVTLRVERTLKGTAAETVTLIQLGGTSRGRTLRIAGLPQFTTGERQIVFVAGNGRVFCPFIGGAFGRFHVRTDATTGSDHVFRDDGAPLVSIEQVPLPLATRPLIGPAAVSAAAMAVADFESRIVAVAAQSHPAAQAP